VLIDVRLDGDCDISGDLGRDPVSLALAASSFST
jgi:hypothetical protein